MDRVCSLRNCCTLSHSLLCLWFLLFLKNISFVSIGITVPFSSHFGYGLPFTV
jgi:hypothetical protein